MKTNLFIAACLITLVTASGSPMAAGIKETRLKDLEGREVRLWNKGFKVTVLLFFGVGQKYTVHAFKELERCREYIGDRSVTFLGVVAGDEKKGDVKRLLARLKIKVKVLVDPGRKLAAGLKIKAYPTFAIYNFKKSKLVLQPVQRIGLCEGLEAKLKHALGELTDAQLKRGEAGGSGVTSGNRGAAKRYMSLASVLRKDKQLDAALMAVRVAIKKSPRSARARAILGSILVDLKKCEEAAKAFKRALELNPGEGVAKRGQKRPCK